MDNDNIIAWCYYCKDPISLYETYEQKRGKLYHEFCWEQMNSYGFNEEVYDE